MNFWGCDKEQLHPIRAIILRLSLLVSNVTDSVNNFIYLQLKSVERRYNDIAKRVQRKLQVLEMTRKGLESAHQEIEQAREWIREKLKQLETCPALGFESKVADERLQSLRVSF